MRRYELCDDTCTTDCGHCKGAGKPERYTFISIGDGHNGISMVPGETIYAVMPNGEKWSLGILSVSDNGVPYMEVSK